MIRDWALLDEMPEGWQIDKTAGSPLHGYVFVTNGKSVINGQERALLRVVDRQKQLEFTPDEPEETRSQEQKFKGKKETIVDAKYMRAVNELARAKFKQQLLSDILVDLKICEIEGWCKYEYISELQQLISGLAREECIELRI